MITGSSYYLDHFLQPAHSMVTDKQHLMLKIIRLTEKEIDAIIDIENKSFPRPWSADSFLTEFLREDSYNYGAIFTNPLRDKQIISYISYRIIDKEMHLLKIAVTPQWRERGIASWLLSESLNACENRGIDGCLLEVRPSNVSAIRLYQKLDFKIIGKRPHYYSDTREDALVMRYRLKEEE